MDRLFRALAITGIAFALGCSHTSKNSEQPSVENQTAANQSESAQPDSLLAPEPTSPAPEIGELDIDASIHDETEVWIKYFTGRGRDHFARYLERSGRYMSLMKKALRQNGVPEDLVYIALIESGFSGKIRSHAGAVGYWQFIRDTGKRYGLRVDRFVDERWDPVKSTEAAAKYFKGLYNLFDSWVLAMASYNVGENRIKSVVMKNYTRDFKELARRRQLPMETIHYVPKFLAARQIAQNPEKYGFSDLDYVRPLSFDVVVVEKPLDLKTLALASNVTYQDLKDLNPSYKTNIVPIYGGEPVSLRIPRGTRDMILASLSLATVKSQRLLASITTSSALPHFKVRVRRGETLASIAQRYGIPSRELMRANGLRTSAVRLGQSLKIPNDGDIKLKPSRAKASGLVYVVRRGDTLTQIARRHSTSVQRILKANKLASNGRVQRGQKLYIPYSKN
ncbi:MAG: LysM peptidoglycan-binding domain-containing protein [Oligoflexia bacterium]|nr:LysM peptidoglycan-binding domain-containing protein [Oligoflexia bacterium]